MDTFTANVYAEKSGPGAFEDAHMRRRFQEQNRDFIGMSLRILRAPVRAPAGALAVISALLALACAPAFASQFVRLDYNITMASRARDAVFIELFDDKPLTQANFMQYVNAGLYDGSIMHRLAQDFVLQGGGFYQQFQSEPPPVHISLDPTATVDLDGNPATPNPSVMNEYSVGTVRSNQRGTIAMARVGGMPNSATNQWFVNYKDNSFLDSVDGGFTVFAKVSGDGMAYFDAINSGPPIYITNLNPDSNNDGQRDGGPFFNYSANPPGSDGVPFLDATSGDMLVMVERADRVDYLGPGITTTVSGGLTFSARDVFIDNGTLFTGAGQLTVGTGRTMGIRDGTVLAGRFLENKGTLQPGLQLGSVVVQGFKQNANASLEIQIGGTTVDTQYDRLVVSTGALLGGDLDISLLNFNPSPGQSFTVLTAAFFNGEFDNINLPALAPGLVWDVAQSNTALTLSVWSADFNRDGTVDNADYVLWRKMRNTTVTTAFAGADANGDKSINDLDFDIWRRNFGNSGGGTSGGSFAVPEPAGVALLLSGFAMIARIRSRRVSMERTA